MPSREWVILDSDSNGYNSPAPEVFSIVMNTKLTYVTINSLFFHIILMLEKNSKFKRKVKVEKFMFKIKN